MTRDNRDPDFDPLSWFADESETLTSAENARDRREANADPSAWFADESVTLVTPSAADATVDMAAAAGGVSSQADVRTDSSRAETSPLSLPAARVSWPLSSLSQWSGIRLLTFSGLAFVVGFAGSLWVARAPGRVQAPGAPSAQASNGTATPSNAGSRIVAEPNRPLASRAPTPATPRSLPAATPTRPQPQESTERARPAEREKNKTAMLSNRTPGASGKPTAAPRPELRRAPVGAPVGTALRAVPPATPAEPTSHASSAPIPAAVPVPAGESLTLLPAGPLPEITAPLAFEARAPAALEEAAVRRTLDDYADAYEGLDVDATARVWPTVDRQALARAFATLKSQGVAFAACNLDVAEATAVARCHGSVRFVRRIGNPAPRVEQQQWLFRMRKLGADWKIEEITAGRTAASSTETVRGNTPPAQRRH